MDSTKSGVAALTQEEFGKIFERLQHLASEFKAITVDQTTDAFEKMKRYWAVIEVLPQPEERFVATYALIAFLAEYTTLFQPPTVVIVSPRGGSGSGPPSSGDDKDKKKLN